MERSYEALVQRTKIISAIKTWLIAILIGIFVVIPAARLWERDIQEEIVLRSAKNVLTNTEFLSLKYAGITDGMIDVSQTSGLKEEAEAEVYLYSGSKGTFRILRWNQQLGKVMAMEYSEDNYYMLYSYDAQSEKGYWKVYRKTNEFEIE